MKSCCSGWSLLVNSPPWGEQLGEGEQLCLVRDRAEVKGSSRLPEPNLL